jgi:hypothetical protein
MTMPRTCRGIVTPFLPFWNEKGAAGLRMDVDEVGLEEPVAR